MGTCAPRPASPAPTPRRSIRSALRTACGSATRCAWPAAPLLRAGGRFRSGRTPWGSLRASCSRCGTAQKLYALAADPKTAPVKLDQTVFNVKLNDTPKDYSENATRVLAGDAAIAGFRCFVLVSHRLQDSEKHANLMDGIVLAPGGGA